MCLLEAILIEYLSLIQASSDLNINMSPLEAVPL